MKNLVKLLFLMAFLPALAWAEIPGLDKAGLAPLEAMVDKAVAGYNAGDWKAFYGAGWAEQTKGLQTEQSFTTLYKGMYLKQFGTLKSKKLNESRCSFSDMVGLLVYDAQFSNKKGTLAVNFFKEGGKFKIQQVRIDP